SREGAGDVPAWRDQVRLVIGIRRLPVGAPGKDGVVSRSACPHRVERADCHTQWIVGGRVVDSAEPAIAGGGHDEDTARPKSLDGEIEHALRVRALDVLRQREVDDPDVVGAGIVEDPLERGDYVARVDACGPVDVDRIDSRTGSNADETP